MKKRLYVPPRLLIFAFLFCTSVQSAVAVPFPQDGVYSYDFERYVDCVEITAMYQAYGMEAFQTIQKTSWGNAVYMQDGSFVEPETRIQLSVSPTGAVTSPDNPSISGKLKRNGDLFFQGYYEENSQTLKITINGKLLRLKDKAHASKAYDGDFILTDSGSGRRQKVRIENGLYTWEYEDKADDDFETWPVIVGADGKIDCGFEMTVHTGVKGLSDMLVSSSNRSMGKVEPSGIIQIQTLTQNYGTGQSVESETITFSGSRGAENLGQISKENDDSQIIRKLKARKNKKQNQPKENPPEWYSDFIPNDEVFIYGSARKSHEDRTTALKIAEITAVSQIKSSLLQDFTSYTSAEKSMTQNDGSSKTDSQFFRAVESFSTLQIPYTVRNSFYDEKTQTAYVVVCLERRFAEE